MTSFGSKGTQSTPLLSPQLWVIPLLRACLYGKPAAVVPSLGHTCKAKRLLQGKVLSNKQVEQAGTSWLTGTARQHEHSPRVCAGGCAEGKSCELRAGQECPLDFSWAGWAEGEFHGAHSARAALPLLPAHTEASLPSLTSTGRFQGRTASVRAWIPPEGQWVEGSSERVPPLAWGWPHPKMLCKDTCHSVQELRDRGFVDWQS